MWRRVSLYFFKSFFIFFQHLNVPFAFFFLCTLFLFGRMAIWLWFVTWARGTCWRHTFSAHSAHARAEKNWGMLKHYLWGTSWAAVIFFSVCLRHSLAVQDGSALHINGDSRGDNLDVYLHTYILTKYCFLKYFGTYKKNCFTLHMRKTLRGNWLQKTKSTFKTTRRSIAQATK